jgi:ribosomal-protein-alanine N-acetyltransferase
MIIRTLFKSDLNQLLDIEKAVHVTPWDEETFNTCFQAGYIGWVMEYSKKIIGFILISQTADECHILNLCVLHEFQHRGRGQQLLQYALVYARQNGIGIAYLEVRKSNTRAISLYRKMQFHLIGQRKNYYPTEAGAEDALIFALNLREKLLDFS